METFAIGKFSQLSVHHHGERENSGKKRWNIILTCVWVVTRWFERILSHLVRCNWPNTLPLSQCGGTVGPDAVFSLASPSYIHSPGYIYFFVLFFLLGRGHPSVFSLNSDQLGNPTGRRKANPWADLPLFPWFLFQGQLIHRWEYAVQAQLLPSRWRNVHRCSSALASSYHWLCV